MRAVITLIFLMTFMSCLVYADWRPYAYSYAYRTAYQGEKEFELYTDYFSDGSIKNQFELEYGISDRWMVSAYAVLAGGNLQTYKYSETKLQTRFRFGEPGQYIMDPAIYLEYKMPLQGENKIEFKEILSKDFGEFNLTTNLVLEKAASASSWEKGYTFALSKMIAKGIRAGVEIKGGFETNSALYIGPSLAYVWGRIKLNLVAGIGANTASKSLNLRNILSFEF
jgi:hypothetical protein